MIEMKKATLGVIGGVGPLATVYFADMVVRLTRAACDQDHIPMLIFNDSQIPDRTAHIMDSSKPNPLPTMIRDAKLLESCGVDYIAIPCNTAHYFYSQIQSSVKIPIINIIEETVKHIISNIDSVKKIGIMATAGTIYAGSYQRECQKHSIECLVPNEAEQRALMDIIYNQVKAGRPVDNESFMAIIEGLKSRGCDAVILGCTELSIIHSDLKLNRPDVIDSLRTLAEVSIKKCNKRVIDDEKIN